MANDQQGTCKDCGCKCKQCTASDHDVHLHVEIENLKQKLVERDTHIAAMENNVLNEAEKFPNGEMAALQEELLIWQDKYARLHEAHRRIQKVNQGLEDKLLRLVDVSETDKNTLTKDVATLSHKLAEANYAKKKLTEDNERYKNDVALAIQFLQCKQSNFVSQKLDSLPDEVQAKVSSYVANKRKPEEKTKPPEVKSIKVPIPTFPPTAMVYSIPKTSHFESTPETQDPESPTVDIVSAAIMAKVLEERERERALAKHCDTCTCSKNLKILHDTTTHNVGTQTDGDYTNALCLKCNIFLESKDSGVTVVKDCGTDESKSVPIYTNDYDNNFLQVKTDILNVEPNIKDVTKSFQSDSSAKNEKETVVKGPRYCSVRLQSGSKNILLDNMHNNNIAPVLYTHPDKKLKRDDHQWNSITKIHDSKTLINSNNSKTLIDSFSSNRSIKKTESYSSDDSKLINYVNESIQNQQRVAEWIQSNQDIMAVAKGDLTKKISDAPNDLDAIRYAEMENNVKKFLFGESQSEFLKTVAIGKQNYQNLRDYSNCRNSSNNKNSSEKFCVSRSNSHTETDI